MTKEEELKESDGEKPMETCPSTTDLSSYFDSEVSPDERERIERHAAGCARCGAVLRHWRIVGDGLRTDAGLPADLAPGLWQRLHPAPERRPARRRWSFLPLSFAATATVAAGLLLGNVFVRVLAPEPPVGNATMALFDPVPPGGICIGRHCAPVGRL
jgi:anti-sigma factor RsiW